jgi:hypothetical protein
MKGRLRSGPQRDEAATMPVFSTWGLNVISVLAERLFVKRQPLAR